MKKILLAALLAATPVSAELIDQKITVKCQSYKTIVANLMVDYNERMIWEGQQKTIYHALYVNRDTGSWTTIFYNEDKESACMVAAGIGYDVP